MNFVESASPLNNSNASRNDNNIVQPIEKDSPVKNKRGMPSEYSHQGTAENIRELKLKAKENGLTFKDSVGRNAYFDCKNANCGYKWKCRLNDDLFYEIFETIEEHNHDNIAARKNGLTNRQKDIIIHRINGMKAVNPKACLQAFRNEGIRSLPTNLQVRNFVYQQKQKSKKNILKLCKDNRSIY
uniref:FLYWCH-type domain-containing protein n=1 Tax=Panagrolaimus davidi TaxID=227884 RepID=A0A914QV59_9BILA